MQRSPLLLAAVALFALAPSAAAQYNSGFEGINASSTGTILTGQDGYYIPAGTTSSDWEAYSYAGNTLGVPLNPLGQNQFIGAIGPAGSTFERAQRDTTYVPGVWSVAFDVCVTFQGVPPSAQNIGSFSLQPSASSAYFIALARWQDPATASAWNADYVYFDANGTSITAAVPDPGFQGLMVNHWYRWQTIWDFTSNRVLLLRITDLTTGVTSTYAPTDWYLAGGTAPLPMPTAFRWFCGSGSVAGNSLAFDNANLDIFTGPFDYQVNNPASSLVANGLPDPGPFAPISVVAPMGSNVLLDFSSSSTGLPWDVGLTSIPAVAGNAGGILTPGGQLINIDVTDPSYTSLFGLSFVNAFTNLTGVAVSSPGPAMISGQLAVVDPGGPDGIALSHVNEASFVPCANPENFDMATVGVPGVFPPCWSDGGGTYPWRVHSGGTPSGATGPTGDNTTGAGNYMYCETSAPALVGDTFILNAPVGQPTGGGAQFAYHMYGATMGTLELQEFQGGVWTTVWSLTGDQGNAWNTTPIILLTTNPTTLRFVYTRGTSFTGDCAIDDFLLL